MKTKNSKISFGKVSKLLLKYKHLLLGLTAVTFLYLSVAGMISITTPWFMHHGDTKQHIDYIWRFYNGDIPQYSEGITYPKLRELGVDSYQQAAANPPLFYVIHAPIVGPLLNEGQLDKAIAVGRIINLFIGVLCIVALSWAGWVFGGRRRELFAVAVPGLATTMYWFLRLNRDYALDSLLVLIATLNFIAIYKLLQHGLRPKYIMALAILSIAGMSTKASFIVMIFTSLVAIMITSLISDKKLRWANFIRGGYLGGLVLFSVIISIGWFYYYWNYKSSGIWFRPFDKPVTTRPYSSLSDVLYSPLLWALFYARYTKIPLISTAITSFAAAGVLAMKNLSIAKIRQNKLAGWTLMLMLSAFLATVATQVVHAVGYGSINFRYLLPVILPISLFLAYGLLEFERAKGQLVALAAILMSGTTLLSIKVSPTQENLLAGIDTWEKGVLKMYNETAINDVPLTFAKGLVVMFVVGAVILPVAMFYLSRPKRMWAKEM